VEREGERRWSRWHQKQCPCRHRYARRWLRLDIHRLITALACASACSTAMLSSMPTFAPTLASWCQHQSKRRDNELRDPERCCDTMLDVVSAGERLFLGRRDNFDPSSGSKLSGERECLLKGKPHQEGKR